MSLLLQITLGILIAGGIGFGVWNHEHHKAMVQQPPAAVDQGASTTAQTDTSASVNLSAGSTNADLDADLSTIDQQMSAVNSDSASIDASMNDKPITQ